MGRRLSHLAALAAYAAAAWLYSWPLPRFFGTRALGLEHDASMWMWNLWHMRHAVVELGANPLWTDYQYWPWGANLLLHHYGIFYGALGIALQGWLALHETYNLLMLGNLAFGGFFVYLLARAYGAGWGAAFAGGAVYAFSPFVTANIRMGVGLEYLSLPVLPAFVWALTRLSRTGRWADAALCALALSWVWSCNYYYFAVCSVLVAFFYLASERPALPRWESRRAPAWAARILELTLAGLGGWLLWTVASEGQPRFGGRGSAAELARHVAPYFAFWGLLALRLSLSWRTRWSSRPEALRPRAWGPYLAVFGFWALLNLPLVWTVLGMMFSGAHSSPPNAWRGGGNPTDLLLLLRPLAAHPLWGRPDPGPFDDPASGHLSWLALAAALWLWRRRTEQPEVKLWFAAGVFSFLLTLGPWLKIAGVHLYLPLPFYFLHLLPVFNNIQTGYRLNSFTTLFLALLAATALKRARFRWAPAAFLGALALEYAHVGMPLFDPAVPGLFHRLGERPAGAILPVPFGALFEAQGAEAGMGGGPLPMHYQSVHKKPYMGGSLGRASRRTREEMHADAFLKELLRAQDGGGLSPRLRDPEAVGRYLAERRVRYVLVRRGQTPEELRRAVAAWPLRELDADGEWTLYEALPLSASTSSGASESRRSEKPRAER